MTYPYYQQQMPFSRVIPVSSENDMSRYTVDFNGTPTYFYNQATNEIFVKQFDMRTGITNTQKFVKAEVPSVANNEIKIDDTIKSLDERIDTIKNRLDTLEEKAGKNAK